MKYTEIFIGNPFAAGFPMSCCLCKKEMRGIHETHNPSPVVKNPDHPHDVARCCEECNVTKVIPARIAEHLS